MPQLSKQDPNHLRFTSTLLHWHFHILAIIMYAMLVCEMLKNMGRPGYEARKCHVLLLCSSSVHLI